MIMLQRCQLSNDGCLKILLMSLALMFGVSAAESPDFCKQMCQIDGSTSNCNALLAQYEQSENLPRLNFICCLGNSFFPEHTNFTARLTESFANYLLKEEKEKDKLIKYAICIGNCSSESYSLTQNDCDTQNPTKCTNQCSV